MATERSEVGTARRAVTALVLASRRVVLWLSWQVAVVLGICVFAIAGLLWLIAQREAVGLGPWLPLMLTATGVWTAVAVVVTARRRLGERDGALVLAVVTALLVTEASSYPFLSLRWVCTGCLIIVPLVAVMLLRTRLVVVTTAACMAGAVAAIARMPDPLAVRLFDGATVVAMVAVPAVVVGTLLRKVEDARALAVQMASTDQLTGMLNRRGMHRAMPALVAGAVAGGGQVTVVLLDLDHFKRVNDEHGHLVGDQVLVAVADTLRATARAGDLLVRFGGEEMAWITSTRSAQDAALLAERARRAVADQVGTPLPAVTVSLGVARCPLTVQDDTVTAIGAAFRDADAALYEAKRTGRDRVVLAPAPAPTPAPTPQHQAPSATRGRSPAQG